MTDEHICRRNFSIQEMPDIPLWGAFSHHQVASNLNVTSIQDRLVWRQILDQRNQSWDLRVINLATLAVWMEYWNLAYDNNMCSSLLDRSQWSTGR